MYVRSDPPQGMSLVPAVTELMLAELLYLQYDSPTSPVYMYINSTGVQVWDLQRDPQGLQPGPTDGIHVCIHSCRDYRRPCRCISPSPGFAYSFRVAIKVRGMHRCCSQHAMMSRDGFAEICRGPRRSRHA